MLAGLLAILLLNAMVSTIRIFFWLSLCSRDTPQEYLGNNLQESSWKTSMGVSEVIGEKQ